MDLAALGVLLAVVAGAVVALVLEAAGEAELFPRLLAHVLGAAVVLLLGDYGLPGRALYARQVMDYFVQPPQLLFVWLTAIAASLIDSALGRHLLLSFLVHLAAYYFALSLLH